MKYRRLKSTTGDGTIMRYYELKDTVAYCNAFYGVKDNKAEKIEGTVGDGIELIGFSHGGNNLAKGLIFLDINPHVVYMGILSEEDTERPNIGEVVNGYQKVIDTHYDGDAGVDGKNNAGFGVETLDNPYYLFTIVEPTGTAADEIDDSEAGETSGVNEDDVDPTPVWVYTVTFNSNGGSAVASQTVTDGETATEPDDPTKDGSTFAGWYSDEELTTEFNFATPITQNTTLYAKWTTP